jgi:putative tryptophan/tyrosine transport system substrate-binding protein
MRRREFIALLGALTIARPPAVEAQVAAGKLARVGLFASDNPVMGPATDAFLDELRRTGFVEGQNLTVDRRSTAQDSTALQMQAAEVVRANPDVLAALGSEPVLQACMQASRTLPIVFVANNYDPIARGYVRSLAAPGGNATGVFLRQTELAEKQVELLTEAFPDRTRLAVLWDAISADQFAAASQRASLLGLEIQSYKMEHPPYDIAEVYRNVSGGGANSVLVLSSQFIAQQRDQIVEHAINQRLPTMFIFKAYVEAGGLLSYGANNKVMYRQGATYVAKILRGTKPIDLPVEQPTTYELAVNLRTAKTIGVELPTSILLRADEVIE